MSFRSPPRSTQIALARKRTVPAPRRTCYADSSIGRHESSEPARRALITTDIAQVLKRLPQTIFHATLASNTSSIEREGLHCARTLIMAARRANPHSAIHDSFRASTVILPTGAALRDQCPMAPALLARCLDSSLDVGDWYRLVNARVFFWLDVARLAAYLKASSRSEQVVYSVDTEAIVLAYASEMEVTPFNVGYAMRRAAPRGLRTFVPIFAWAQDGWDGEKSVGGKVRPRSSAPVEVAIRGSIPDFHRFIIGRRSVPAERSRS